MLLRSLGLPNLGEVVGVILKALVQRPHTNNIDASRTRPDSSAELFGLF